MEKQNRRSLEKRRTESDRRKIQVPVDKESNRSRENDRRSGRNRRKSS